MKYKILVLCVTTLGVSSCQLWWDVFGEDIIDESLEILIGDSSSGGSKKKWQKCTACRGSGLDTSSFNSTGKCGKCYRCGGRGGWY